MPNIISSELYPTHARSAGVAAATGTQFACNALVVAAFPTLRAVLGERTTLSCFAGLSFLSWLFVLRYGMGAGVGARVGMGAGVRSGARVTACASQGTGCGPRYGQGEREDQGTVRVSERIRVRSG